MVELSKCFSRMPVSASFEFLACSRICCASCSSWSCEYETAAAVCAAVVEQKTDKDIEAASRAQSFIIELPPTFPSSALLQSDYGCIPATNRHCDLPAVDGNALF